MESNKLNLKVNKEVNKAHQERIEEVIKISKLKEKPNNWIATESDYYRNRVYIFNKDLNKEFSIAFTDGKSGYNYFIYERQPISDDAYRTIIQQRPELEEYGKEALASVVEIDKGFKRKLMPMRTNAFKIFLEENHLDIKNEKIFLSLGVSSTNMAFNTIIQVMPWSNQLMIIERISLDQFDEIFMGLSELSNSTLSKELDQKTFSARVIIDGDINLYVDDVVEIYQAMGFEVLYNRVSLKASEK